MAGGIFLGKDLTLPEWSDGLPGHATITFAELHQHFEISQQSLTGAIVRGEFPPESYTLGGIAEGVNTPEAKRFGFKTRHRLEAKSGVKLWRLSTIREWIAARESNQEK